MVAAIFDRDCCCNTIPAGRRHLEELERIQGKIQSSCAYITHELSNIHASVHSWKTCFLGFGRSLIFHAGRSSHRASIIPVSLPWVHTGRGLLSSGSSCLSFYPSPSCPSFDPSQMLPFLPSSCTSHWRLWPQNCRLHPQQRQPHNNNNNHNLTTR